MLMQSYHTRSIRHRILKNIRADDTLNLTFQGHKVKKWQKMTIFIYNVIQLDVIAVIHATSIRYRTKINMWVDDFSGFNVQGHLQGQNDRKIPQMLKIDYFPTELNKCWW